MTRIARLAPLAFACALAAGLAWFPRAGSASLAGQPTPGQPTPGATAAPAETASATPVLATPQASATAPPASATPAPPTAAPTPTYRFVYRATPAPDATPFPGPGAPQIIEIDLTDQYLVTPGQLNVRVVTNPEVQTVTAQTMGYSLTIPRSGPGVFGGVASVGPVAPFLKGRLFPIDFVATVPGGRTADVTLQLGLK